MIALIGAFLTMAGAVGAGICICMDREGRVRQLRSLERAFEVMAGEISYSRISLPEVLKETGEKMPAQGFEAIGAALCRIGDRLCDGSGQDVETVWKEEMEGFLKQTKLAGQEKELVLSFPSAVWFLDGPRQQAAVLAYAQGMREAACLAQKKKQEENRLTMALSLACGAFAAIMLL